MIDEIILLNSRRLNCYPKENRIKPKCRWPPDKDAQNENRGLFYTNVYNLIINEHEIMSESRYFLSSVGFNTSICPTLMPCVGAFIEWWKYRQQFSWSEELMPICDIRGNLISGYSECTSVSIGGLLYTATLQDKLIEVVKSFNRIANRYIEAQGECESYPLDYVLSRLPYKRESN